MAPKAKAAGKRAAKAKAAPKASAAGADLQAGVTRWLGRRDTDEAAERSMQEHFPTSSRAQRTQKLVHGVSMKHHIMAAKRKARAEGKRLGSLFWSGVRELYLSDLQQTFSIKDPSQPVNKTLASALHMCRTANAAARNRKGLIAYMATCRALNQKEMVGLCRLLVTQNYNRNAGAFELWVECMRSFKRMNIGGQDWGQELMDLMLFNFDSVCVVAYAQSKGSEVSDTDFWDGHKSICSLVVKAEDVEQLLNLPLAELPPKAAVVSRVTASSSLGQKMFGWALPVVLGLQLEKALQEDLEGLSSPVTQAKLDGVMQRSYDKMDELNAEDPLNVPKKVMVDYRGLQVQREASTWAEQLLMTIMAWLENKGIQSKLIKELSFEVGLFPAPDGVDFKIDAEVIAGFVQARKAFENMLAGNKLDGAVLVDLLAQKQKVIKGFDKTWPTKVDAFTQLHGEAGKARLQRSILQVLPADADFKSLDDVLGGLAALRGSQLFKFGCKDSKDMLDSVVEVYKSVKAGSFNASDCKESTLMQQVCAAIPWSYQYKDKHAGKDRVTYGAAGLELEVKWLQKQHAAGKLTMEQLGGVNIFAHWLPDKLRKEVENLTSAMVGGFKASSKRRGAGSAASGSKGASSSSTSASSKRKAAGSEQSEFDGIFAELFG